MKSSSIWNVLSILMILGVCLVAGVVGIIFTDPNSALNPFPPGTEVPVLILPSATPTTPVLPPTWTPTPAEQVQVVASATPRPTSTLVPSRTPFVLPSPTKAPINAFPTNDRIPLAGRCKVVTQTPKDGTPYKKGAEFTTDWTIENTGDAAWDKQDVDVRYQSGDAMQKGNSFADLPQTVLPGASVKISVTMIAPQTPGYHITYWNFSSGSQVLCTFYVEIFVEK